MTLTLHRDGLVDRPLLGASLDGLILRLKQGHCMENVVSDAN